MFKATVTAAIAALSTAAVPSIAAAQSATTAAAPTVRSGTQIYGPDARRIGNAYGVERSGVVLVILDGKMARIAPATLSVVNGKVTTSLTKSELSQQAR